MRETLLAGTFNGAKRLPCAVLIEAEAILSASPDSITIDQNAEDVIVGEAVGRGEILPAEHGHVLCAGQWRHHQNEKSDEVDSESRHELTRFERARLQAVPWVAGRIIRL